NPIATTQTHTEPKGQHMRNATVEVDQHRVIVYFRNGTTVTVLDSTDNLVTVNRGNDGPTEVITRLAGEAGEAARLITLNERGGDCTEDESAWIMRYFDRHHPMQTREGRFLSSAYPLEHAQWHDEVESGRRVTLKETQ
ncbi:MAG: hypothetical protein ACRDZY_20685, partial [Acidimicrobiales bacterium]